MRAAVYLAACAILFIVPVWFIVHRVYKDGFVGRLFLAGIAFCAAGFWMDYWFAEPRLHPARLTVAMLVFFAGFLCWHLWRFHRRVVRRGEAPASGERRKGPDRRYTGGGQMPASRMPSAPPAPED